MRVNLSLPMTGEMLDDRNNITVLQTHYGGGDVFGNELAISAKRTRAYDRTPCEIGDGGKIHINAHITQCPCQGIKLRIDLIVVISLG